MADYTTDDVVPVPVLVESPNIARQSLPQRFLPQDQVASVSATKAGMLNTWNVDMDSVINTLKKSPYVFITVPDDPNGNHVNEDNSALQEAQVRFSSIFNSVLHVNHNAHDITLYNNQN